MNIPKNLPAFVWHYVKKQKLGFSIAIIAAVIWSVNEVFFPYFLKLIIDTVGKHQLSKAHIYHALLLPLIGFITIWLFTEATLRVQGFVLVNVMPKFRADIRRETFQYVKQHSHEYFSNNFAGSIAKKLNELPTGCQTIMEIVIFNFIFVLMSFLIAFIMLVITKPIFSFVLLTWFVIHMGLTLLFLKMGNIRWAEHSESNTVLSGKVVDSITNILSVRLFSRMNHEENYVDIYQRDEIKKAKHAMFYIEWLRLLLAISSAAFIIGMIFLLIHGWQHNQVSLGDFSFIGMISYWLMGMIWYMSYQLSVFVREVGTLKEALSLITVEHGIKDKPNASPLIIKHGEIKFDDVDFSYRNDKAVFKHLNLIIRGGQKVGLVGFSGSGKSTFVNLILRFYDIQTGTITIDEQNIAEITQNSLRENIAMIPQDPSLFHRTLLDNIRYGNLNASDEEVMRAAKLAHCDEFIRELPEQYHALVGERGVKLSGGQRQRISIARAILKNAPILILDEATSALDTATERVIQQSLESLMQNRTTIVIAHRLSTLTQMDRIIVFHDGQIIEDGSKDELLTKEGHFAKLWALQSEGFLPEK